MRYKFECDVEIENLFGYDIHLRMLIPFKQWWKLIYPVGFNFRVDGEKRKDHV